MDNLRIAKPRLIFVVDIEHSEPRHLGSPSINTRNMLLACGFPHSTVAEPLSPEMLSKKKISTDFLKPSLSASPSIRARIDLSALGSYAL
jgi:hypothetical protein